MPASRQANRFGIPLSSLSLRASGALQNDGHPSAAVAGIQKLHLDVKEAQTIVWASLF